MSDAAGERRSRCLQKLKEKAQRLQAEIVALVFAYRDARTPWYARAWAGLILAYALSPLDLIPDFIPVLGYLDDLILIPAGIALALKMIPAEVMAEAREKAKQAGSQDRILRKWGAAIILCIWLIGLALIGVFFYRLMKN